MTGRARNGRPKWSAAADTILRADYAAGVDARITAAKVGHTFRAVGSRARLLGLKHRSIARSLEERFFEYVHPEPNSGCWLWAGRISRDGYGQFRAVKDGRTKCRATHISLEIAGRPLPKKMFACHTCDVPACVNPDHLFHATASENTRDSIRKGRWGTRPHPLKEKCKNGHHYVDGNFYIRPDGSRACLLCRREYQAGRRKAFVAAGFNTRGNPRGDAP